MVFLERCKWERCFLRRWVRRGYFYFCKVGSESADFELGRSGAVERVVSEDVAGLVG